MAAAACRWCEGTGVEPTVHGIDALDGLPFPYTAATAAEASRMRGAFKEPGGAQACTVCRGKSS